jgi:HD-GYP domain-containing protein (c-di-GMP phosphodiesterase class II)
VRVARSLASHAAISIENAELYAQIERTLESFVKASVTAIDQRDPTTAGHAVRVATLATEIATAVDASDGDVFGRVHFTRSQMRELRFAALLHDFGKVVVRDDVLLKAKKLPPLLWERIDARFDLIRRTIELDYQRRRACVKSGRGDRHPAEARLDQALADDIAHVEELRQIVRMANEPSISPEPLNPALNEMSARTFLRPDGSLSPYLTREELHFLHVPRGTLDDQERAEVESHVVESYRFLADIPWTDDLQNLASYAYGHHEKLDGTGYPRRLRGDDIPIQTRILTIADMFDALTEADRPYKPAVSVEQAIKILRAEADAGLLDADLVQLLVDTQAYCRILDEDWHTF